MLKHKSSGRQKFITVTLKRQGESFYTQKSESAHGVTLYRYLTQKVNDKYNVECEK